MINSPNKRMSNVGFDTELLDELKLNEAQNTELAQLLDRVASDFQVGQVITGKVLSKSGNGVLVDINYKSNGLISNHEFSDHELKDLSENDEIEVLLDRLEDIQGNVVLSFQKAKSIKAWNRITQLAEKDEPVEGIVTHKVKGGLSIDIGIPAFLPGSQVDIHRVLDFDQFLGDSITCKILKVNRKRGNVIVSRRRFLEEERNEGKKRAMETIAEGQVLDGIVKNITNYGAFVDVGGVDGLLHITDMSWGRISHPSELVKMGDTIKVKVLTFDREHEKISLGMKQLTGNPWSGVEDRYTVGNKIKGTVSSITDYGLFIEVERGIEGLVHISEVSWKERITNLGKYYKVGQEIDVIVVSIDKNNRRMSLSIKQLEGDPWRVVADQYKLGDKISGEVTNVTDFGLFVQLHTGVDGLVHVSDISWTEHITHPNDRFKKGDAVEAIILSMDVENKKISLGIKQLTQNPWDTIQEEYPVGSIIKGKVSKVTNFGAFVRFDSGIEGLVHISEFSNKQVEKPEEILQVGKEAEFKVIKVNATDRKIGLSYKAVTEPRESSEQSAKQSEQKQGRSRQDRHPKAPRAPKAKLKGSLQQALSSFKELQNDAEQAPASDEKIDAEKAEAAKASQKKAEAEKATVERTLAMIKPDAVSAGHADAIIARIEKEGFTIVEKMEQSFNREKAEEFYAEHKDKPFFEEMIKDITASPVIFMVLEKEHAIRSWRELMGATDPAAAAEGTLRKEFGTDIGHNAVHGSDSSKAAQREIDIIFGT